LPSVIDETIGDEAVKQHDVKPILGYLLRTKIYFRVQTDKLDYQKVFNAKAKYCKVRMVGYVPNLPYTV
jgi:hypothetical protein